MKLIELRDDGSAVGDVDGSRRLVDLSLVADPAPGEYVIVHAGFAIEKLDEQEANERLALFEELAQADTRPAEPENEVH